MDKSISFLSLWEQIIDGQRLNRVVIPIIQRDYAQGRENKRVENIRKNLLNVFFEALVNNNKIELDFIYGDLTKNGVFIPLDGQQRLTTLFLLHWYIARHEGIEIPDCLFHFSYETRFSSREFCEKLLSFNPKLSYSGQESLSSDIINQSWFERAWAKTDPTIKSMLVMLDDIHAKFGETRNVWEKLTDKENPAISFYLLLLSKLSATEDIYVKMNARGKELSEFEHFKAYLEDITSFTDENLSNDFAIKIDTTWTDLFWKHREEITSGKVIKHHLDTCLLNYYRLITSLIAYKDRIDPKTDIFSLAKHVYGSDNPRCKEHLKDLIESFDCWAKIDNISTLFSTLFTNKPSNGSKIRIDSYSNLFQSAMWHYDEGRMFTLTDTLMLYGIIEYLKAGIMPYGQLKKLRQLRNMIWQSTGNEVREERLTEILEDVDAILSNNKFPSDLKVLNKKRAKEEIEKETLISANPDLYPIICDLEDHDLLLGRIGVLGFDSHNFANRANTFINLFGEQVDFTVIARALLTFGDYSQDEGWGWRRWNLGGKSKDQWSSILTNYDAVNSDGKGIKDILCQLLDEASSSKQESELLKFLDNLSNTYIESCTEETQYYWLYYFIKYPVMLTGESGIYVWEDSFNIRMLDKRKLSGSHRDVYLSGLYKELGEFKSQFESQYKLDWFIGNTNIVDRFLEHKDTGLKIGFDEDGLIIKAPTRKKKDFLPLFDEIISHMRGILQDEADENTYYLKTRAYDGEENQLEYDHIDRIKRAALFLSKFLNNNE